MANKGCEYCKYDISESLIDSHNLIKVCCGQNELNLLGFELNIRYDENDKPLLFVDHMDEAANTISSESVSISYCPMCGREL